MYLSNKFNSSLFHDKLSVYYSDINDQLVNSMIAFLTYKQFGISMFEQGYDFKYTFNYIENSSFSPDYIEEVKSNDSSLLVFSWIPLSISSKFVDYGYVELNTPECPISRYLTEEDTKNRKSTDNEDRKMFSVFVNKNIRSVILSCTQNIDEYDFLRFFSASPRIWSWIFDATNLNEDETKLFKEMSKKHKGDNWFAPLINKLYPEEAEKIDRYHKLKQYSMCGVKKQIEDLENEVWRLNESINRNFDEIALSLSKKETKTEQLTGLKNTLTDGDESVLSFFDNLKEIEILEINLNNRPELKCTLKSTLDYFDRDKYETIRNNPSSYLNQNPHKDILEVMDAIFMHDKGRFIVKSEFTLCGLSSMHFHKAEELNCEYNDCLPTPHLGFYRCLGSNELPILNYLKEGRWDSAIYQTLAATKNVNFGDSVVVEAFLNYCNRHRAIPFIVADNGTSMTINEFLKYINEKKVENE